MNIIVDKEFSKCVDGSFGRSSAFRESRLIHKISVLVKTFALSVMLGTALPGFRNCNYLLWLKMSECASYRRQRLVSGCE